MGNQDKKDSSPISVRINEYIESQKDERNEVFKVTNNENKLENCIQHLPKTKEKDNNKNANLSTNEKFSLDREVDQNNHKEYPSKQQEISGKVQFIIISSKEGKNILSHPKITKKLIDESVLGQSLIGDIEVRGRGKSIKIGVKVPTDIDLATVTKVGEHPVSAWSPLTENQSVGVIFPISKELDVLKEIIPNLKQSNLVRATQITI